MLFIGQDNLTISTSLANTGNATLYTFLQGEGVNKTDNWGGGDINISSMLPVCNNLSVGVACKSAMGKAWDDTYCSELYSLIEANPGKTFYLRFCYEYDVFPVELAKPVVIKLIEKFKRLPNVRTVHQSRDSAKASLLDKCYVECDYIGVSHFLYHDRKMPQILDFAQRKGKPLFIAETCLHNYSTYSDDFSIFKKYVDYLKTLNAEHYGYIDLEWVSQPMWRDVSFWNTTNSKMLPIHAEYIQEVLG